MPDAPSPHGLLSDHHTGQLDASQFLAALLADGTRPLTGNLAVSTGVTIDGVDISVFYNNYQFHLGNALAHNYVADIIDDNNALAPRDAITNRTRIYGVNGTTVTSTVSGLAIDASGSSGGGGGTSDFAGLKDPQGIAVLPDGLDYIHFTDDDVVNISASGANTLHLNIVQSAIDHQNLSNRSKNDHHDAFVGLEAAGVTVPLNANDRINLTVTGSILSLGLYAGRVDWSVNQGSIDHGSIGGLGDDDHANYVHISAARTITAQHTFSPTTALPPFVLGANAQGQLVTGLNADSVDGFGHNQSLLTTASPTFVDLTLSNGLLQAPTNVRLATSLGAAIPIYAGGMSIEGTYVTAPPANGLYVEGDVGIGSAVLGGFKLYVSGSAYATTLTLGQTTGIAPMTIASTTLVSNLNADLWDSNQFADYLNQAVRTTDNPTFGRVTLSQATGTSPMVISSTTVVGNLNADLWDGYQFADYLNQAVRTGDSPTLVKLTLSQATGAAPLVVASTTVVANLNADLLDGYHASTFLAPTYLVVTNDANLTGERALAFSDTFGVVDGGAGGAYTVSLVVPGALSVSSTGSASGSHTHAITSSSAPGAVSSLLKTDGFGGIQLDTNLLYVDGANGRVGIGMAPGVGRTLDVTGNLGTTGNVYVGDALDVNAAAEIGGDLTVGPNVLFVSVAGTRVGINRAPDQQFDLDVAGPIRGTYLVGEHAIQLKDVAAIVHFDGPGYPGQNFDGTAYTHMGVEPSIETNIVYVHGLFDDHKAAQFGLATTNYCLNPSFELALSSYWTVAGSSPVRSASDFYYGEYCLSITTAGDYVRQTVSGLGASATVTISAWVKSDGTYRVGYTSGAGAGPVVGGVNTDYDWQRISATGTASAGGTIEFTIILDTGTYLYADAVQVEVGGTLTPYADGSMGTGHAWTGTAHESTSTRGLPILTYDSEMVDADRGTVMLWVRVDGFYANNRVYHFKFSDGDFDCYLDGDGDVFYRYNGTQIVGGTLAAGTWQHLAFKWDRATGTTKSFLDGVLQATGTPTFPASIGATISLGALHDGSIPLNGSIDDFVILTRPVDDDLIRSVAESNAPVFAESSVFHFRAPSKAPIWIDEYGLWARGVSGDAIFGIFGGDPRGNITTKSWGGVSLEENDVLIGRAADGYVHWDDSLELLTVQGKVLVLDDSQFMGIVGIGVAGGIFQGTGTFATPTTGYKLYNSGSIGLWELWSSGTKQVYADTSGLLRAGAGAVTLSAEGIQVADNPTEGYVTTYAVDFGANSYKYIIGHSGLVGDPNAEILTIASRPGAAGIGRIYAQVEGVTAQIVLTATGQGSSEVTSLSLYSDNIGGSSAILEGRDALNLLATGGDIALTATSAINVSAASTFITGAVKINSFTASRILATDSNNFLVSTSLFSWIASTPNRVSASDDGDGTITLTGPQDIHTAATPTFGGGTFNGLVTAARLNVDGSIYANASQTNTVFTGTPGADNANIIGSDGFWAIRTDISNRFNLDVYNAGVPLAALTVDQGGKVGVGAAAPVTNLHVHEVGSGDVDISITNDTTGATAGDGFQIGIGADESAHLWNRENTPMYFATNNLSRMQINANGNVGIDADPGTTYKMYVNGVLGVAGIARITDGAATTPGLAFDNDLNTGLYRAAIDKFAAVANGQICAFFDGASGSGRVGIAMVDPAITLDVNGNARLRGNYLQFGTNGDQYIRNETGSNSLWVSDGGSVYGIKAGHLTIASSFSAVAPANGIYAAGEIQAYNFRSGDGTNNSYVWTTSISLAANGGTYYYDFDLGSANNGYVIDGMMGLIFGGDTNNWNSFHWSAKGWLNSNILYDGVAAMLHTSGEQISNVSVAVSAVGSGNDIRITFTNNHATMAALGSIRFKFLPYDGIITKGAQG